MPQRIERIIPCKISHTRREVLSKAALGLAAAPSVVGNVVGRSDTAGAATCPEGVMAEGISIADFGARGDGRDQTAAFNRARDTIQARGSDTLQLPRGDYRLNALLNTRFVHLRGAGNEASILKATSAGGTIVRATHSTADWAGTRLSDIGFEGTGKRQGVGFRSGDEELTPFIEYTGRFLFDRVRFNNLARAIDRPFGNIGFDLTDCAFGEADFHIWSRGQPVSWADNHPMHPGCLIVTRGSMHRAHKASIYIDGRNVAGAGQLVFDGVRFENNPGWVFYIKNFNDRGPVPGIVVRSCWNESNHTASSVEIDGETSAPGFANLTDVAAIAFEDTPVGPLVLENSHVVTRGCNLDLLTSLTINRGSSLVHHDARMFAGTARGLVSSIGPPENADAARNLNTPWFPMPVPAVPRVKDAAVLIISNARAPERWGGSGATTSSVGEVALPWVSRAQQLAIAAGAILASPFAFTIPGRSWLVLQFVARLVSGPPPQVHINGMAGFGGVAHIRDGDWCTYTAVLENSGPAIDDEHFYIYSGGTDSAVMRFSGYAVTRFGNSQSALAFANSRLFPRE